MNGLNATVWRAHNPARQLIYGIALGLPAGLRLLPLINEHRY